MLVPSPSVFPSASLSSSPSATASLVVEDVSAKDLAWQTAAYLAVVLVIVALISAVILIIWNDGWSWRALIPGPGPGRPRAGDVIPGSAFILSPAQTLVEKMLCWFSTTLVPAFRDLRQTAATSEGSATPGP
ncbi:hypothetical protein BC827DRAFT_1155928 [Russula dissimulans]|nr:hypothetical protein BC827DRAFT_1155928 [Russula dissimulans]